MGGTVSCAGDGEGPNPKAFPYRFEVQRRFEHPVYPVDLDRDGEDEIVWRFQPAQMQPPQINAVVLETLDGSIVDQLNYNGNTLPPLFKDVNGDGHPEILVPVLRNDSLFLSVAGANAQKLYSFFLINGQPRHEPEGDLRWDPAIVDIYVIDADRDGERELVTVLNTGYARLPRGVLVNRLPGGERLGEMIIGAAITRSIMADFDNDSLPEVLLASAAFNNGADAGGFDDRHSYLIVVELAPEPRIEWSREMTGIWELAMAEHVDLDGDGAKEIVVLTGAWGGAAEGWGIHILDSRTWSIAKFRTVPQRMVGARANLRRWADRDATVKHWFSRPVVLDLDRDMRPELVVLRRAPSEVWAFNADLELIDRRPLPVPWSHPSQLPDLDGDGLEEIVVGGVEWQGALLLGPDLGVRSVLPPGGWPTGVLRRGIGRPPLLLLEGEEGTLGALLERNPLYLVYRFGPAALLAAVVGATAVTGLGLRRLRRRRRVERALQAVEFERGDQGSVLLTDTGDIRWTNQTVRHWAGTDAGGRQCLARVEDLAGIMPDLAGFVEQVRSVSPPRAATMPAEVLRQGAQQTVWVSAEPVAVGLPGDPHWLIRITDADPNESYEARTWPILAQRVAHSLKNPLTSMLLTLQRLQMEYRESAPAIADRLDHYAERIEGRVEALRKLTSNFLKFVNVEEPELKPTDLSALVEEFAESSRKTLPSDIRLSIDLERSLPLLPLDREQIQAVLDNLMGNAINAMPKGGVITISTHLVQAARLPGTDSACDYAQLEVMDTGAGIADDIRQRIFEPGFSSAEEGSGLGLAIAKKVVEDQGGTISMETEVGSGTAFSVYLPLRGGAPATDDAATARPSVEETDP